MLSKKEIREEKKKRKLKALVNIMQLNASESEGAPSSLNSDSPDKKKKKIEEALLEDDVKELRKTVREKKRNGRPTKLGLKNIGNSAHIDVDANNRMPIFVNDVPNLLIRVLFGEEAPEDDFPWYKVEKSGNVTHSVILLVEGISLFHFQTYLACFEKCLIHFDIRLECVMPHYEGGAELIEELIALPLTLAQKRELFEKYKTLNIAKFNMKKFPLYIIKSIFPITSAPISDPGIPETDKFPRTQLLLSPMQLIHEEYPFPMNGQLGHRYKNYVYTKAKYADVTPSSPMFGVDCEMVKTQTGVELARISIVDENYKSVYETLVKPKSVVVDYLTAYSGIEEGDLDNITCSLANVQKALQDLLPPDAILVGHSLENDLIVLRMMHPYVIDTSVIFNMHSSKRKSKLKVLVKHFLDQDIQTGKCHDSIEDAVAALKLVQLKLHNSIEFGDDYIKSKRRSHLAYNHIITGAPAEQKTDQTILQNVFESAKTKNLSSALIASKTTNVDHTKYITDKYSDMIKYHLVDSNKDAVKKTIEICKEADLTLTHLRFPHDNFNDENIEKNLKKIDKHVSNIWQSLERNGLMVIIFGGVPGASTGVVMAEIRK